MESLVVLGSANADLYIEIDRMPKEGETKPASGGELRPGGKGANQSAAASLLGLKTYFLGQIGDDAAGGMLENELNNRGVSLEYLKKLKNKPSGQAVVILLPSGQNSIIIIGGANQDWKFFDDSIKTPILASRGLLLQREIPDSINYQAALYAKSIGKFVVLDAGGKLGMIPDEMLEIVDILSPNTLELEEITGIKGNVEAAAWFLIEKGVKHVVVKLSSEGSAYFSRENRYEQKAFSVDYLKIVDTTGAGDCFTAALVVKLIQLGGLLTFDDFKAAMSFASVAAFLSITKKGAMESMPDKNLVEQFL